MHNDHAERIAFLGGGNMARALIAGLLRRGLSPGQISVGEPRDETREALARDLGVRVRADNPSAVAGATLVVLAVKPQEAAVALGALQQAGGGSAPLLLSIAAGLTIARISGWCPAGTRIVRAMPNRPALVGAGVTGLYAPETVAAEARARAEAIASASGRIVWLRDEREIDVVTALSGSGPAYFFLLAEELARAGAALGLAPETAARLAAETLYGAGQLAHHVTDQRQADVALLTAERAAVTSRGGTTEAALRVLQDADFAALVGRAVQAAAARSVELAQLSAASLHPSGPASVRH